jgi:hypothetical protein
MTHMTDVAAVHPPLERAETGGSLGRIHSQLIWLLAGLAMVASLAGLLVDHVYTGADSTAEMFRGYGLFTAVLVLPSLIVASKFARRGSARAQLATASVVGYLVYTYAYYLFGTGFNDLFLLHAAVFATALWALVLTLIAIDVTSVAEQFRPRTPVRAVAGILGALALGLRGMWIYFAVNNAVTGNVPAGSQLVETDTIVQLGIALDLTLLVPLYAVPPCCCGDAPLGATSWPLLL